ncbi:MAG TPA: stalk domain-containing protein [Armatimonadota bacterium]|jgi:tetratricopeptide (TPR) repeat protein
MTSAFIQQVAVSIWRNGARWLLLCMACGFFFESLPGNCAGLTLTLQSATTAYLVDEPLLLTATVRNDSDNDIQVPLLLDPMYGLCRLYLVEPGGKPTPCAPIGHADFMLPKSGIILGPGEAYSLHYCLAQNGEKAGNSLLAKPGKYTLFAQYNLTKDFPGGAVALRSADVSLLVTTPTGMEKQAHDLLIAGADGTPWGYPPAGTQRHARTTRYAKLVQQFPSSRYACYALSEYASDLTGNALPGQPGTPQEKIAYLNEAIQQLRDLTALAKNTAFEAEALLQYGRALARIGDSEHASKAFAAALLSPMTSTYERFDALVRIRLLEAGLYRDNNKKNDGEHYPLAECQFPLLPSARAFGFTVEWNEHTRTATVASRRMKAVLVVGSGTVTVNGQQYREALSSLSDTGDVSVTVRTLGYMLIAHYGEPLNYLVRPQL